MQKRLMIMAVVAVMPWMLSASQDKDTAFGALLAWYDSSYGDFHVQADAERMKNLKVLKGEFGLHLFEAMKEMTERESEAELSYLMISLGFPLFPEEAVPVVRDLILRERSLLKRGSRMGLSLGVATLAKMAHYSPELGCKVFAGLLPDLEQNTSEQVHRLTAPLAVSCKGGADYLIHRMSSAKSEIDLDLLWLTEVPPSPSSVQIVEWLGQHKAAEFSYVVEQLSRLDKDVRMQWLEQPSIRAYVENTIHHGDAGDKVAKMLHFWVEMNHGAKISDALLTDSVRRLSAQALLSLEQGLAPHKDGPSILSDQQRETLLTQIISGWDRLQREEREKLTAAPIFGNTATDISQLMCASEAFRRWVTERAEGPSRMMIHLLVLDCLWSTWQKTKASDFKTVMSWLSSALDTNKGATLGDRIYIIRWLSRRSFLIDLPSPLASQLASLWEPHFRAPQEVDNKLRIAIVDTIELNDSFRRLFRLGLIDPALEVRSAVGQKLYSLSYRIEAHYSGAQKADEGQDALDGFYFALRDSMRLPGEVPEALADEVEGLFQEIDESRETREQMVNSWARSELDSTTGLSVLF